MAVRRVDVVLANRWAYVEAPDRETFDILRYQWSFYAKNAMRVPSHKAYLINRARMKRNGIPGTPEGWDGRIQLFKRGRVPIGLWRATRDDIQREHGIKWRVMSDSASVPFNKCSKEPGQYSYQALCVRAMLRSLSVGGGVVLSATGTGKTRTAAKFAEHVPNYHILFVVDTIDLLYQSAKEMGMWLDERIGVVGNSEFSPERITCATIQTLSKHKNNPKFRKWYRTVKIVIVDELHEAMAKRNFAILTQIDPVAVFGLTATLQLSKQEVRVKAWSFCGPVIFHFPLSDGVDKQVLTEGEVLQILLPERYEGEIRAYQEEYADEVWDNQKKHIIYKKLVHHLIKRNKHVVTLVERVAHVTALSNVVEVPHRLAYGAVSKVARKSAIRQLEKSKIKLLIANKVFKKGVNIKRVDAMVDMAEMKSKNDAIQKYGRGVRLCAGKTRLLYVDIGTQSGRFLKSARSRARAFRAESIKITIVKCSSAAEVISAVEKVLGTKPSTGAGKQATRSDKRRKGSSTT